MIASAYPDDWPSIATRVKDQAGWRCIRCRHDHDPENGYCLTVHHLDGVKGNCAWWNLAALCQRCHMSVQGRVSIDQGYLFEHSLWLHPLLEGRANAVALGWCPGHADRCSVEHNGYPEMG